jgi:2-amino-4-hydroxy-6-hydroxymethyldihydropteridine diphosphokinase
MPKSRSSVAAANDRDRSEIAYVALGSNLGDRDGYLSRARERIGRIPKTRIVAESSIAETLPIGPAGQPMYLNQMLAIETSLDPHRLLQELQSIERDEGRTRSVRWGPRTLDLDIVAFDHTQVHSPTLVVPHPELRNRDFWLRQLEELRGVK